MECKETRTGINYVGTKSTTIRGYQCQAWNSQLPNKHKIGIHDFEFPDRDIQAAGNACRNVGQSHDPWCHTTLKGVLDYCSIPRCMSRVNNAETPSYANINTRNCLTSRKGVDYTGNISRTWEGYMCQAWHKQHPKKHRIGVFDKEFADNDIMLANNHCRNPQNKDYEIEYIEK